MTAIHSRTSPVAAGLTLLLALFANATPALPAAVRSNISDEVIEINGSDWTLRYGTNYMMEKRFVVAGDDRAWLAHECWLRLIDTTTGTVIGRWRFPGFIVDLTPIGTEVELTFRWDPDPGAGADDRTTLTFDPNHPVVPNWPGTTGWSYRVPEQESELPESLDVRGNERYASPEHARALIVELENAVRRDPLSPWLQFALGKALQEAEDPRARTVLEGALDVPSTDFAEWFPMSNGLDRLGEPELARQAFERGYRDFIECGNDPRLFISLVARLIVYGGPGEHDWDSLPPDNHLERVERIYRLSPYARGAEIAWQHLADYFEQQGRAETAALWAARAHEARERSWYLPGIRLAVLVDRSVLWIRASLGAAALFVIALFARSFKRQPAYSFLAIESWSRAERLGFFLIIFIGWMGVGVLGEFRGRADQFSEPFTVTVGGSLSGTPNIEYLEKLPPTSERDLLLATAYHQSGMLAEAEPLYRPLGFPESWNNLGALLLQTGRSEKRGKLSRKRSSSIRAWQRRR